MHFDAFLFILHPNEGIHQDLLCRTSWTSGHRSNGKLVDGIAAPSEDFLAAFEEYFQHHFNGTFLRGNIKDIVLELVFLSRLFNSSGGRNHIFQCPACLSPVGKLWNISAEIILPAVKEGRTVGKLTKTNCRKAKRNIFHPTYFFLPHFLLLQFLYYHCIN